MNAPAFQPRDMFQPRPYQSRAFADIRAAIKYGDRYILYVLPTGGGKTEIFSYIARNAAEKKKRVLIVVHRRELLKQTVLKLKHDAGIINPGWTARPQELIQVATIQTLVNRLADYPHFDLIIWDECHHIASTQNQLVYSAYPDARHLGVTATPIRLDGKGLYPTFQKMIAGPSTRELMDDGYLSDYVMFRGPGEIQGLDQIKVTAGGDYNQKQLAAIMDRPTIYGNAIEHYAEHARGMKGVVFCASVQRAIDTAQAFQGAGVRAYHVDGTMNTLDRDARFSGLASGQMDLLTTCDLVSEGIDIPSIMCGIFLRPTASEGLWIQQMGRCLRPCDGKDRAVLLDHVGNSTRHGLPDSFRDWELRADRKKRKRHDDMESYPIRQCGNPECGAIHPVAPTCPECGYVYPIQSRELDEIDGKLQQVTDAERELLARLRRREESKAGTYEDLVALGAARGYKPGWAAIRWSLRKKRAAG